MSESREGHSTHTPWGNNRERSGPDDLLRPPPLYAAQGSRRSWLGSSPGHRSSLASDPYRSGFAEGSSTPQSETRSFYGRGTDSPSPTESLDTSKSSGDGQRTSPPLTAPRKIYTKSPLALISPTVLSPTSDFSESDMSGLSKAQYNTAVATPLQKASAASVYCHGTSSHHSKSPKIQSSGTDATEVPSEEANGGLEFAISDKDLTPTGILTNSEQHQPPAQAPNPAAIPHQRVQTDKEGVSIRRIDRRIVATPDSLAPTSDTITKAGYPNAQPSLVPETLFTGAKTVHPGDSASHADAQERYQMSIVEADQTNARYRYNSRMHDYIQIDKRYMDELLMKTWLSVEDRAAEQENINKKLAKHVREMRRMTGYYVSVAASTWLRKRTLAY